MLKEIRLPLNTSLLELLTVAFFIAVSYSILYRFSFFSELGVDWFIYSLSPQYILFSSFKVLFILVCGAFLGYVISLLAVKKYRKYIILSVFFLFVKPIIFLNMFSDDISPYVKPFNLITFMFSVAYSFCIFLSFIVHKEKISMADSRLRLKVIEENAAFSFKKKVKKLLIIVVVGCSLYILYLPFALGSSEAKYAMKNKDKIFNKVLIKNSKESWFLIESYNDKFLLMKNGNMKIFKIIEYKDIDSILVPNK